MNKYKNCEKQKEFMRDLRAAGIESGMSGKNAVEVIFHMGDKNGWDDVKIYIVKVIELHDG